MRKLVEDWIRQTLKVKHLPTPTIKKSPEKIKELEETKELWRLFLEQIEQIKNQKNISSPLMLPLDTTSLIKKQTLLKKFDNYYDEKREKEKEKSDLENELVQKRKSLSEYGIKEREEEIKKLSRIIERLDTKIEELIEETNTTREDLIVEIEFIKERIQNLQKYLQNKEKINKELQKVLPQLPPEVREEINELLKYINDLETRNTRSDMNEKLQRRLKSYQFGVGYHPISYLEALAEFLKKEEKEEEPFFAPPTISPEVLRQILKQKIHEIEQQEQLNLKKLAYIYMSPAKLFIKRKKIVKKNAFHFIVDVSWSMEDAQKIETAKKFLYMFSQAINLLIQKGMQIYTEIILFSTNYTYLKKLSARPIPLKRIEEIRALLDTHLHTPLKASLETQKKRQDLRHFTVIITDAKLDEDDRKKTAKLIPKLMKVSQFLVLLLEPGEDFPAPPKKIIRIGKKDVERLPYILAKAIHQFVVY